MLRILLLVCVVAVLAVSIAVADEQFSVVTPQWVAQHAQDADLRILDVRQDPHEYFAGHVPNAVNLADNSLRGPRNGVPVQYLTPRTMAELLARAGVKDNDRVVIYSDGQAVLGATMIAYALEKIGHPNVMIMDGGWSAWKAEYKPSQEYPTVKEARLGVRENKAISVTLDEVRAMIGKPGIVFIDARPNQAYTGEMKIWIRNGHIPGAVNMHWLQLMDFGNPHKFKSASEMQAVLDAKGIKKTDNIIIYCGTSREASLEYAAMRHILGYPNVRLYEGSWTEYSAHPELKVETGNPQ